jgi:hypothetical protein
MEEVNDENLSPHELDQLHSLLGRLRSQRPSSMTSTTAQLSQPLPITAVSLPTGLPAPSPSQQQMRPSVTAYVPRGTQSSVLPSIPAYQSTRLSGGLADPSSTSFSGSIGMGHPSLSQHRAPMMPVQQQSTQAGLSHPQRTSFPSLGFQGLNTSQANQQRLASASTSLPRRPSMPIRTASSAVRRPRGRAGRPPSLSAAPTINDVLVHNVSTDTHLMRTRIKIYPPLGVS